MRTYKDMVYDILRHTIASYTIYRNKELAELSKKEPTKMMELSQKVSEQLKTLNTLEADYRKFDKEEKMEILEQYVEAVKTLVTKYFED